MTDLRQGEERLRQMQKMEAIGRLAGGIAHDVNNVLSVTKGRSAIALMDLPEGSELREDVLEIDHAADRAANLTRQLLAFSRQQMLQPEVGDEEPGGERLALGPVRLNGTLWQLCRAVGVRYRHGDAARGA